MGGAMVLDAVVVAVLLLLLCMLSVCISKSLCSPPARVVLLCVSSRLMALLFVPAAFR